MKTLSDHLHGILRGKTEVITVSDFRKRPGDIFTQVSLGKNFCIKRRGKIVAFLVHPDNADVVHEVQMDGSIPTLGIDLTSG